MGKTIYDFKVEGLDGKEINFADFKGKKSLSLTPLQNADLLPVCRPGKSI